MKNSRFFFTFSLLLITIWTPLKASYTQVEDKISERIKTHSLQDVKRQKITLDNGLNAYLISDPNCPKSGVSLAVGMGSIDEPFNTVGLAHFVEHMIFMGTEEFPEEAGFGDYVVQNGGVYNAYTASGQTVYMFDVNNNQLQDTLLRFSSFFTCPLFNENSLMRERQAIDQEFSSRKNIDGLRQYLVMQEMMNKDHVAQLWRCGNAQTLADVTREDLVSWYQDHYSADKMNLCIYTSMPMDELLVFVDQRFSKIPVAETKTRVSSHPLLDPQKTGQKVFIKPIKDVRNLSILWEVPPEFAFDIENHTAEFVASALCDESPRSLTAYLKSKNWITDSGAGFRSTENNIGQFSIEFDLTDEGLLNHEQIISNTYEAIHFLRDRGIPRYAFDEQVSMAKVKYHYQSRPNAFNYTKNLSARMKEEDFSTFPQKCMWPSSFDSQKIKSFLSSLKADEAVYFVMAPTMLTQKECDIIEPLYGTEYAMEPISDTKLARWNSAMISFDFSIASPNPYIPSDLNLVESDVVANQVNPEIIYTDNKSTVYYLKDSQYFSPEVYYSFYVNSPKLNSSAKNQVLSDLYLYSVSEALTHMSEQGTQAGLACSIYKDANLGLNITVKGYSEKSKLYLNEILTQVKSHQATSQEFNRYKDTLLRSYQNQKMQSPIIQSQELANNLMIQDFASSEDKANAISQISYGDLEEYQKELFEQVYIKAMIYGNVDQETAIAVKDQVASHFVASTPFPLSEQSRRSVLELTNQSSPVFFTASTPVEGNAIWLNIGFGQEEFKKNAALTTYAKMFQNPFFEALRTKQQTGYQVGSGKLYIEKQQYMLFYALSNTHSPRDLLARFELFNEESLRTLTENEDAQKNFEVVKESIITQLSQEPNSLAEKGAFYTSLAFNYEADFAYQKKQIQALQELSFDEYLQFAYTYIGRQNPRRVAVFVEGLVPTENTLDYQQKVSILDFKQENQYSTDKFVAKVEED